MTEKNSLQKETDNAIQQHIAREAELRLLARKRVLRSLSIHIHVGVFILVNGLLFFINIVTSKSSTRYYWVFWVCSSWLIGLLYHAFAVFYGNRGGFTWHIFSFAVVNSYLIAVYVFATPGKYLWFLWILGLWSVGLITHGIVHYILKPKQGEDQTKSWINRKIDKELRKIYQNSELDTPICPKCGYLAQIEGDYCARCGSALDHPNT